MAESFNSAFSTGGKIDKGTISGKVYDANAEGVMIFAYKSTVNETDPGKQNPDYISQVGKSGIFTLLGLADGGYVIYAIRDKLRDNLYQKNEDGYGVQYKSIELTNQLNEINGVDFFMTLEDTISPQISNVIMKDRNHLLIEFTDKIDSTKLSAANFYFYDSAANKKIFPSYIYKGYPKQFQFYLVLKDTL